MSCGQFDLWIVSDDPADRERALIHAAGCPRCGEIARGQEWLAGEAVGWREDVEAPAELEDRIRLALGGARAEPDIVAEVTAGGEEPESGRWITMFMEATWSGHHIGLREGKGAMQRNGGIFIQGDNGTLGVTPDNDLEARRWDGSSEVFVMPKVAGETVSMYNEISNGVDCVRNQTPPDIDVRFGAEVIAVCGAAYYSQLLGRAVTVEEFKALL